MGTSIATPPFAGGEIPGVGSVNQDIQAKLLALMKMIGPAAASAMSAATSPGSAGSPARVGSVANVAGAPPPVPGQTPSPVAAQGGGSLSQGNVPIPQRQPSPGGGEFTPRMPSPMIMPNDYSGKGARAGAITQNILQQVTGAIQNSEKRDYEQKKQQAKYVLEQYYEAIARGDTETANDIVRDPKNRKILKDALEHQPWEIKENKPNPNYDALKEVVTKRSQQAEQSGAAPSSTQGQQGERPTILQAPQGQPQPVSTVPSPVAERPTTVSASPSGGTQFSPRPGTMDRAASSAASATADQAELAAMQARRNVERARTDPSQLDPLLSREEQRKAALVESGAAVSAKDQAIMQSDLTRTLVMAAAGMEEAKIRERGTVSAAHADDKYRAGMLEIARDRLANEKKYKEAFISGNAQKAYTLAIGANQRTRELLQRQKLRTEDTALLKEIDQKIAVADKELSLIRGALAEEILKSQFNLSVPKE